MNDLSGIAPGLTCHTDGIWRAATQTGVDYPDDANAFCFGVEDRSFWFRYRNRVIVDVVRRFPPSGPIADIGAGNGYVSLALQREGFPTIVIEPGPAGAGNARARGLQPIVCATLQDAAFRPRSLDAAGLFDVLEHIEDDERFLREVWTVIKPGGRVYLTVPAFPALWSSEDDLVGHHRRYTIRGLSALLQRGGFTTNYVTYLFSPLPLPLFLLRSLPSRLGRRPTLDPVKTASELQPAQGVALRLMTTLLDGELAFVRRGFRVPFGTSCLVAATATGTPATQGV